MKKMTWIAGLVILAAAYGCNDKSGRAGPSGEGIETGESTETEESTETAEETTGTAETATEEEVEEPEMAVAQEDIDHAAEVYAALHDESLDVEGRKEKFAGLLGEYGWDVDAWSELVYDISLCPESRAYYSEQIGEEI